MNVPRYFLPEHPKLTEVYSKAELRALLQAGEISRSDIVTDDETGIAHLLGDLLAMPFRDASPVPTRSTSPLQSSPPPTSHEFRADTPLKEEEAVPEESAADEADPLAWDDEFPEQDTEDEGTAAAPDEDLAEEEALGEELLYLGHPSWFAFPKSLFIAAVCAGSAVWFQQHRIGYEWILLLGSITGMVLLFIGLDRATTTYYVTTRRVEMEFGIIGRNTKEVRIADIRAIDVVQQGYGALVGIGTVKFDSSATAGPEVCFRDVRRPHDIKQLVRELQG